MSEPMTEVQTPSMADMPPKPLDEVIKIDEALIRGRPDKVQLNVGQVLAMIGRSIELRRSGMGAGRSSGAS